MIHSVCHASTKYSWYDRCNYNLWSRRVVTESLSTAWSLSGNFHCGWAFPSPPTTLLILYYFIFITKDKRQQNSKLAGPPPAHNPTPGHFSRSCPSPLLLLHLLLILQVNFTAPSFEHSFPLPLFSYWSLASLTDFSSIWDLLIAFFSYFFVTSLLLLWL